MKEEQLYTKESNGIPQEIATKDGYLLLVAYSLYKHHSAHYPDEYYSVPIKLCKSYVAFFEENQKMLHVELRKMDGTKAERFTDSFKKRITDIAIRELQQSVEDLYQFLLKELSGRTPSLKFHRIDNAHIQYEPFKKLMESRSNEENLVMLCSLPDYLLKELRALVNKVAANQAKLDAYDHVQLHIDLNGSYSFKQIAKSVDEIYHLMGCPGLQEKESLKELVNKAIREYEIENKTDFLLNNKLFYQSVYNSFKAKLGKS